MLQPGTEQITAEPETGLLNSGSCGSHRACERMGQGDNWYADFDAAADIEGALASYARLAES
jgi:hypothetical protein